MRENERYCQHLPAGVDKVASPSHVKCLMWPQLDLSRELLGFHTHFKSRSVRIALCFSIILSSGNTPPKLSSCEFSSVITPETRAFGPEEDEPADTPPPPPPPPPTTSKLKGPRHHCFHLLPPLVLSRPEGKSSHTVLVWGISGSDRADAEKQLHKSKEDTSKYLWVRPWLGLPHTQPDSSWLLELCPEVPSSTSNPSDKEWWQDQERAWQVKQRELVDHPIHLFLPASRTSYYWGQQCAWIKHIF